MSNNSKKFDFRNNLILPLVVFVIGIIGGRFTDKFWPNSDTKESLKLQNQQLHDINKGFSSIVQALSEKKLIDTNIKVVLNDYSVKLADFSKFSNDLNIRYKNTSQLLDTNPIAVNQSSLPPATIDTTKALPGPALPANEIILPLDTKISKQIDELNQIAFSHETPGGNGSTVVFIFNNVPRSVNPGKEILLKSVDNQNKPRLVYVGKTDIGYVFRLLVKQ